MNALTQTHSNTTDPSLTHWLREQTAALDAEAPVSADLLSQLAAAGAFRIGVSTHLQGSGGETRDALIAIAQTATESLRISK